MLKEAVPSLRVAEPSAVEPSENVTVPVGVPLPGATAVTVAVNVTDCVKTEGFTDDVTTTVLPSWLTTCERADEVLASKLESPPYITVIERVPTGRDNVVNTADPPLSAVVSIAVEPS